MQIDHIIVLMMENRSFDHMLGYLSLEGPAGGKPRGDVDGLVGGDRDVNYLDGTPYAITSFGDATLTRPQDPGHKAWEVGQQMANGMKGFVENYASTRVTDNPGEIMRYQSAENVPVYDWLSTQFAVLDRWFCSVPGSTWPNRLVSLTGKAWGKKDNEMPPVYEHPSFVRLLPEGVKWRWYSSDPGSLRFADDMYRFGWHEHFAYVEKPSMIQPHTLYRDMMDEDEFPNVAWIDPNFVDLGGLTGADDDHPPTDVMAGQSFILKIYEALRKSPIWKKSMLVITYDEHGGFYDHVDPTIGLPAEFAERSEFAHFGPRVPAFVISPWVDAGAAFGSRQPHDPCHHFDHTALIKTILTRFAPDRIAEMPNAVGSSSHLGHVLTADSRRGEMPPVPDEVVERVADWWGGHIATRLRRPVGELPAFAELGVVQGPTGAIGAATKVWDVVNRLVDLVREKLGLAPRRGRGASRAPVRRVEMSEATELERGVAAAAGVVRSGPNGVPPGQP